MEVNEVRDFWENRLPKAVAKFPDPVKEANVKFRVNITDLDGPDSGTVGNYIIDSNDPDGPVCRKINNEEETGNTIQTMSAETFATLYTKPSLGMQMYFTGKLQVEGDQLSSLKSFSIWKISEKI